MSNQSTDLRLLRAIPAHTETFRFRWLQRNFTVVDETYRHIRRKVGGTMLQCDWCNPEVRRRREPSPCSA